MAPEERFEQIETTLVRMTARMDSFVSSVHDWQEEMEGDLKALTASQVLLTESQRTLNTALGSMASTVEAGFSLADRKIGELADVQRELADVQRELAEAQREWAESQRHTDEKLNALIDMWLRQHPPQQ